MTDVRLSLSWCARPAQSRCASQSSRQSRNGKGPTTQGARHLQNLVVAPSRRRSTAPWRRNCRQPHRSAWPVSEPRFGRLDSDRDGGADREVAALEFAEVAWNVEIALRRKDARSLRGRE